MDQLVIDYKYCTRFVSFPLLKPEDFVRYMIFQKRDGHVVHNSLSK